MTNQVYELDTNITPTNTNSTSRTFLPPEMYLPEWARDTEFFRCMTILLDYLQNSLKDLSNPKYAMIEQAYKDIGFKYKDIMQTSEESLRAMLIENGFGKILEIFKLSLEQLQMIALYLPLLKIMKGTDKGYRLFLSLFASDFEIETWLDNPQELEEYTFNILFISWVNVGFSADLIKNFIEFSRSYVYPILKKVEMAVMHKFLSPSVYGYPKVNVEISAQIEDDFVIGWSLATRDPNMILASSGTIWTQAIQNYHLSHYSNDYYWQSLAYNGIKFVALGSRGHVSTSTDGITWATVVQDSNLGNHTWRSLAYDGTKFVALSYNGYVSTSIDGTTWTQAIQDSNLGNHTWWISLAYDGAKFVAISEDGYTSYSVDGISWTQAIQDSNLGNHTWRSLAYDGTKFVALSYNGYISYSADGISWAQATQNSNLSGITDFSSFWRSLAYDGTKFVAISNTGYISTSTDGTTWTQASQNSNLGEHAWLSLAYDGTKFVALSNTGYISTSSAYWTNVTNDGTKFVAISNTGYISTSVDGMTWSSQQSLNLDTTGWQVIIYDNFKFISINTAGNIATSSDGTTWTLYSTSNLITNPVFLIYTGSNYIVFVNPTSGVLRYPGVYASTDCINWKLLAYIESRVAFYSVAYGNNAFVRVFTNGDTHVSSNAIEWATILNAIPTTVVSNGNNVSLTWSATAFDGAKFIAMSKEGYISYSTNGIVWSDPEQIENLGEHNWHSTMHNGSKTLLALSEDGYTSTKLSPIIN